LSPRFEKQLDALCTGYAAGHAGVMKRSKSVGICSVRICICIQTLSDEFRVTVECSRQQEPIQFRHERFETDTFLATFRGRGEAQEMTGE